MNKSLLIIEMPELSHEVTADIHKFLQALLNAFESHHISQLRQYYRNLPLDDDISDLF